MINEKEILEKQQETDKSLLTSAIMSFYDMQKLRIQAGNRICAAFRAKTGLLDNTPKVLRCKDKEEEAKRDEKILATVLKEY